MINDDLNIVFAGGDIKHYNIYKAVGKEFRNTFIVGYKDFYLNKDIISRADVIILPTVPTSDGKTVFAPEFNETFTVGDILNTATRCNTVICGLKNFSYPHKNIIAYTKFNDFKLKNAIPTAEGAICIAINNTDKTLYKRNILIIGAGCIGKYLARCLKNLGANVYVSARKEADFDYLNSNNIPYINSYDIKQLDKYDIIFNTVPKKIINDTELLKIRDDALYIELASKPYGIIMDNPHHFNSILASSLPGKYSLVSATEIITETIINILKGENNGQN